MKLFHPLSLLFVVLIVAACGPEAPARANRPASETQGTPLLQEERTALSAQPGSDVRTMGNPHAPIVVVEYGDYQ
jgi:protein-disulfide isomerase